MNKKPLVISYIVLLLCPLVFNGTSPGKPQLPICKRVPNNAGSQGSTPTKSALRKQEGASPKKAVTFNNDLKIVVIGAQSLNNEKSTAQNDCPRQACLIVQRTVRERKALSAWLSPSPVKQAKPLLKPVLTSASAEDNDMKTLNPGLPDHPQKINSETCEKP